MPAVGSNAPKAKDGGVWKSWTGFWARHSGSWKKPLSVHVRSGGNWVKVWDNRPIITNVTRDHSFIVATDSMGNPYIARTILNVRGTVDANGFSTTLSATYNPALVLVSSTVSPSGAFTSSSQSAVVSAVFEFYVDPSVQSNYPAVTATNASGSNVF